MSGWGKGGVTPVGSSEGLNEGPSANTVRSQPEITLIRAGVQNRDADVRSCVRHACPSAAAHLAPQAKVSQWDLQLAG